MNILNFFNSNKGISTPILLLSVVSIVVITGGLIVFLEYPRTDTDKEVELKSTEQTEQTEAGAEKNAEKAIETGQAEIKAEKETETETKAETKTEAKEIRTDEILSNIKNNLKNVKTVHAKINEKNYTKTSGQPISETWSGSDEYDFVFPNKKQRFFSDFEIFEGEAATIVIDDNIYLNLKPVRYPIWFLGKDGQQDIPFFDGPIDFNLTDYPDAWDFTQYAEAIEEDLGIEEINGIKCHHYTIKFKKIPGTYEELEKFDNHFFKNIIGHDTFKTYNILGITNIEQEKNKIRFFDNDINKEISILIDNFELANFPFEYISIAKKEFSGDDATTLPLPYHYSIRVKEIQGEIWVGKDDLLVHKENYVVGHAGFTSRFLPNSNKDNILEGRNTKYYMDVYNVAYSDFNKDITIEHPLAENVITTMDEFLKYSEQFEPLEPPEPSEPPEAEKQEARDARRKSDIRQIATALELFYNDAEAYVQATNMPSSIPVYMDKMPKDPVSEKNYKWIDNTKDSSKFCVYTELEQGGYYAVADKGGEVLDIPPKDLSCW